MQWKTDTFMILKDQNWHKKETEKSNLFLHFCLKVKTESACLSNFCLSQ